MPRIEYSYGEKIGECSYIKDDCSRENSPLRFAFFKCKCGNEFSAVISKLKNGHTKSCGCLQKEVLAARNNVHGFTRRGKRLKEYNIWLHIKRRCTNPNTQNFKRWGGRGITMCKRWSSSFINFMSDMGNCPENYSIDRIDNDGNYEPSNCRWASQIEQCNNTSKNIKVTYNGEVKTISEWSRVLGIPYATLRFRIVDRKQSPSQAFNVKTYNGTS